ncbi:MAG: PAS domain S-box protein [Burkholderiales bacterium]|nr:PAS domain S-box protein [Burkholderiales bacterium]
MFVVLHTPGGKPDWHAARRLASLRRLERWLLRSFAAGLGMLVLLGAASLYVAGRSVEAGDEVVRSEQIVRLFAQFETEIYRSLANHRGYAIEGDVRMRARRDEAIGAAARLLETLQATEAAKRYAELLSRAAELVAERRAHFAAFDETRAALGPAAALRTLVLVRPELLIGDDLRAATAAEQRRLAEARESRREAIGAMYTVLWAAGLALAFGLLRLQRWLRREIAAREQADAACREADERLERALSAARVVLWEADLPSGTVSLERRLDDPDRALRLPQHLTSAEALQLVPVEEHASLRAAAAEALCPGGADEWSVEHRMRGPGDEWRWVLTRGRVTERDAATGRPLRAAGTSVDITERKIAEERLRVLNEELERRVAERTAEVQTLFDALRDSEQMLRAIVEGAPAAIVVADTEGRIALANPAAERIFGRRASEMVGTSLDLLVPERFRAAHREHLRRFAAGGESYRRMGEAARVAGLRADGSEFPLDAAIARFAAGGRDFLVMIGRDATEEVRAMQQLRELTAELERRVAERTAELEAANRDLESFAYSVAHDLRAPIRAVHGFAGLLEESDGARLSDEGRRLLGVIQANALRMGGLVDGLLRLSRIGRATLRREETDLAALARKVAAELSAGYPATRIEIGELPPANADRALAEQLLVNLIGNALKYSARRPEPRVEVGYAKDADAYFVRDNGEGFDMAWANKLFRPFQRLHGAEFEGSGIGLAIVHRIVARHGGRVWAESAPGAGAIFYFTLGSAANGGQTGK